MAMSPANPWQIFAIAIIIVIIYSFIMSCFPELSCGVGTQECFHGECGRMMDSD